jgi:hypothetical protein
MSAYPRGVYAVLYDRDGVTQIGGSPLTLLATAFDMTWYDEENGPGHATLSIPLSEAGAAQLLPGRFITFFDLASDDPRFTFKIEGNPEYKIIQEGEEFAQIMIVEGRGWGCEFDEAIVLPAAVLSLRLDTSWRLFSFASPDFPNLTGWTAADELYEYLEGVAYGYRYQMAPDGLLYPSPIGWPYNTSPNVYDPASPPGASYQPTYWIWPTGEEDSLGWAFFRGDFVIPTNGAYTYAVTGDNYFTLFIEGTPVLGESDDILCWLGWKDESTFFEADTYSIAGVVENPDWPVALNPGGFLANVFALGANNMPETHILSTDSSWSCLFVDAGGFWPGWTPGQIIDKLIDEAVARGALVAFNSHTFTDDDDSNSDEWRPLDPTFESKYVPSFAVQVGSTVMAALGQMKEEGLINWHVQPGTLILDVYRAREPGSPSSSATFNTTNLRALERNSTAPYANALLVQWENGYVWVVDSAEVTSYGTRVEDIYSSDATSEADATRLGNQELARRAQAGFPSVVAVVEPTSAADCPYEAFTVGDYVTIPAVGGGTELVRVLSIAFSHDAEGNAIWTLELNAKLEVPERRTNDLLRTIGGRNQVIRGTAQ